MWIAVAVMVLIAVGLMGLFIWLTRGEPEPLPQRWIQYGSAYPNGDVIWHPSQAAHQNNPDVGYSAWSVARDMVDDQPVSEPRRVFPQDPKALRNED